MASKTLVHGEPLPERSARQGEPSGAGAAPPAVARMIDAYRLVRRIGEGGMGEVWLAEQTAPVEREVAVKLVKPGGDSRRVVARFEAERQALAVMSHPAIASVFDGGSTGDGQPYFVMEHVDGRPVTEYADAARASIRERLDLIVEICRGVQHAHHKGVIHRDLKPSNILVTTASGRPQPKIIDFGIAKALDRRLDGRATIGATAGATPEAAPEAVIDAAPEAVIDAAPEAAIDAATEAGTLLGTPEYMSPEQAGPSPGDIDTRADVYSLGVMLYELLVGALPFSSRELRGRGLDELCRMIREVEPDPPSEKLAALGDAAPAIAASRGSEPGALARRLRGDLDAIVMKALDKDRGRRYGSAAELAGDLGRYLANEPVLARPASAGYRLRKYARRHRAGVAVAVGAAAVLLGFTAALAVEVRTVARERDRANREAVVSGRVLDFMVDMFKVSDPDESRGAPVTARAILDRAAAQIGAGLAADPDIQARLMATMARVYDQLGLDHSALPLAEQAVATQLRVRGAEDRETLRSQTDLAMIERELGRRADAEALLRAVLATQRRLSGPDHPDTLTSEYQLAAALDQDGRAAEGEPLLRHVVDARRRMLGAGDPATLMAINSLAVVVGMQGRTGEAEQMLREVYDVQQRLLGPDHPVALAALHNLGSSLARSGHFVEGEAVNRAVVATSLRVLGPDNPETLGAKNNLAFSLAGQHRRDEAERLMSEVLAVQRRVLPADHPRTALTLYNLACNAALQGRRADALAYLRESFDHGMAGRIARRIADDADLASLRGDPAFEAIVAEARARAR